MSFVAVAIGGSAVLGAGASIYSGTQMASATGKAAGAQAREIGSANATLLAGRQDALAQLDPFKQTGLRAGQAIEQGIYSPQQQQQQREQERVALLGEISKLGKGYIWEHSYGDQSANKALTVQIAQAREKLKTFDQQTALQQQQAARPQPGLEASPWYQFQAELLGRTQDRAFAARGLTGSGFEAEERRRGLIELGAGETERQFGRLKGLYDVGANAANAGAGAITGTSQSIANNQVQAGQAQAQGILGVAGANANMATGVANAATGAVGAGLNYYQFQNLINANKPPDAFHGGLM